MRFVHELHPALLLCRYFYLSFFNIYIYYIIRSKKTKLCSLVRCYTDFNIILVSQSFFCVFCFFFASNVNIYIHFTTLCFFWCTNTPFYYKRFLLPPFVLLYTFSVNWTAMNYYNCTVCIAFIRPVLALFNILACVSLCLLTCLLYCKCYE